ncbi:hypothetical protein Aargi30884_27640 [Amedibacterium intestinale]|uniref:PcfK-like protein n=1 Tax=Amedibacterium intestinale TaxID=2583452 RepID=A0A6N4TMT4_9FIRM|nr:Cas9 inhibitor AcrIIA9 family protein [Amedibacterium intestinale]BBK23861.1 hypothetical protein Aargi30884_27640 [Amedibacterium intestinale]DAQ11563.1 MAG TPA: PcfK-like protein [Caudoviricetes sp.]
MMFEEELKKEKNPAVIRIGNYLKKRAETDTSVKNNLNKENKSLKECWDYVLGEVAKTMYRNGNFGCAAGDDEDLYALAVHYYDEDDIKIEPLPTNMKVEAKMDEDKKEEKTAEIEPKEIQKEKVKRISKSKKDPVDGQISLF